MRSNESPTMHEQRIRTRTGDLVLVFRRESLILRNATCEQKTTRPRGQAMRHTKHIHKHVYSTPISIGSVDNCQVAAARELGHITMNTQATRLI